MSRETGAGGRKIGRETGAGNSEYIYRVRKRPKSIVLIGWC